MSIVIPINELTVFQMIRQILIHELEISEDRVMIFNQKWNIPTYDHMFLLLQCQPSQTLSSRNYTKENSETGEFEEIQELNLKEHIIVSVFSRNMEAFERKEEVVAALYSIHSQQLQEKNSFKILNRNASIEDLTVLEGAAQLYRYDIPIILATWYQKKKKVDFYDQFPVQVNMNDGLPNIDVRFSQPT